MPRHPKPAHGKRQVQLKPPRTPVVRPAPRKLPPQRGR
jgi:hypothetical protein